VFSTDITNPLTTNQKKRANVTVASATVQPTEVLDQASEFVEVVCNGAQEEYQRLLKSQRLGGLIEADNSFNHGKLFAYAEFVVFRREFKTRFPGAGRHSCINTFCRLLLKNDISITNLVNILEKSSDDELIQLKGKSEPARKDQGSK